VLERDRMVDPTPEEEEEEETSLKKFLQRRLNLFRRIWPQRPHLNIHLRPQRPHLKNQFKRNHV
jgi:hypothetical protein